ncbi:MAG: hypothetical protein IMX03_07610 [Brockia lithotrophica]|nr:hypothetical protein [Brockia lithotrophica]
MPARCNIRISGGRIDRRWWRRWSTFWSALASGTCFACRKRKGAISFWNARIFLLTDGVPICSRPLLWRVWIGSPLAFSAGDAEAYKAAERVRKKISEAGDQANVIVQESGTAAHNRRLLGDIKDGRRAGSRRMASPLHATVRRLERKEATFDGAMDKEAELDGVLAEEAATQGAWQYAYVPVVTEVCPVGYSKDVFRRYEERKREFLEVLGIRP